jgi:ADP-ribosylglycohydrolase
MDIIESVPAAIALVELAKTQPMKCAMLAANLGGDTDTIGAMATAICGALHGIEAFPEELYNRLSRPTASTSRLTHSGLQDTASHNSQRASLWTAKLHTMEISRRQIPEWRN